MPETTVRFLVHEPEAHPFVDAAGGCQHVVRPQGDPQFSRFRRCFTGLSETMKYNQGVMIVAISRGKRVWGMIRISVQVSSGTARFRVAVQAERIERGLKSVAGQCPGKACEV